ncbi:MAG TPA: alanine--tRNA ligase [bacterium]|nr:alanine--tRNA ligase [bacterium]
MTGAEIREAFLRYFEERGHTRVPSASLVPAGDPTLLFVNAGMVPFKDVFLGLETRPYRRATSVQKCMRVSGKHNDLDNVGPSPRHHTFFEMLGNFSFGEYFKRDAIRYAWEFVTGPLALPPDRLVFTVFTDDDEAAAAWAGLGIPEGRVLRMGEKTNFWMMGDVGPCGPTSELHYDWGPASCTCGRPDCSVRLDNDCGRWLEIWNLVFMQYTQAPDGSRTPLPRPGVDTGMGLERIASVVEHVATNYETDLFVPVLDRIQHILGHRSEQRAAHAIAYRVLADHGRAMTFLIADGVVPGNEGRAYVLRMIIRRAVRFARQAGARGTVLGALADAVTAVMGGAYPELAAQRAFVQNVLSAEEHRFDQTLEAGLTRLDDVIAEMRRSGRRVIPGADVFRLYDTYGFPPDLTRDVAREHGLEIDEAGFAAEMAGQKARSRAAESFTDEHALRAHYERARAFAGPTVFVGYDTLVSEGSVAAISRGGAWVEEASPGDAVEVVTDRTPFYAESGGQVGDTGQIRALAAGGAVVAIDDTRRPIPGLTVHYGRVVSGSLRRNDRVQLSVDAARRQDIMRNHTATHLLHTALREVLGAHARQAGSLVAPDRLRFDFVNPRPLTPDERSRIEARVNAQIRAALPVTTEIKPYREALASGAVALFGEKYGDEVRVVSIDGYSRELCGGTHVRMTAEIGRFVLSHEGSVGSGIRRIEAVTGRAAEQQMHQHARPIVVHAHGKVLRDAQPGQRARKFGSANSEFLVESGGRRHVVDADYALQPGDTLTVTARGVAGAGLPDLEQVLGGAVDVDGVKVVGVALSAVDSGALRAFGDRLRSRLDPGVVVAASAGNGRMDVIVMATPAAVARGAEARRVMQVLNRRLGTRGGGRAELAQGGGGDPARLAEVLADLSGVVREALGQAADRD